MWSKRWVEFRQHVEFGQHTEVGQHVEFVQHIEFGQNIDFGQNVVSGQNVEFGQNVKFGQNIEFGQIVEFGQSVEFCQIVNFGQNIYVGQNVKSGYIPTPLSLCFGLPILPYPSKAWSPHSINQFFSNPYWAQPAGKALGRKKTGFFLWQAEAEQKHAYRWLILCWQDHHLQHGCGVI